MLGDPRDSEAPQGTTWSEHGGSICWFLGLCSGSSPDQSTHTWKHTAAVAQELSKY